MQYKGRHQSYRVFTGSLFGNMALIIDNRNISHILQAILISRDILDIAICISFCSNLYTSKDCTFYENVH